MSAGRLIRITAWVQLGLVLATWLILTASLVVTSPREAISWSGILLPLVALWFVPMLPMSLIGSWMLDRAACRSRKATSAAVVMLAAACALLGAALPNGGAALGAVFGAEAVAFAAGVLWLRRRAGVDGRSDPRLADTVTGAS